MTGYTRVGTAGEDPQLQLATLAIAGVENRDVVVDETSCDCSRLMAVLRGCCVSYLMGFETRQLCDTFGEALDRTGLPCDGSRSILPRRVNLIQRLKGRSSVSWPVLPNEITIGNETTEELGAGTNRAAHRVRLLCSSVAVARGEESTLQQAKKRWDDPGDDEDHF